MDFVRAFGRAPQARADAPGRVNLLGEHTDYNEGYVLPTSIPQRTRVAVAHGTGTRFRLHSDNLAAAATFTLDRVPAEPFARYVFGALRVLAERGVAVAPLDIGVASDVPIGAGLSSSAALTVAVVRAVRALLKLDLDDVGVAEIAHRAENDYAGVRCGILDQMACSLLEGRAMLFLDTRTLARSLLPLPPGAEILVLDSGVSRSLAASGYNQRRAECEAASRQLGVPALRDATLAAVATLPEPLRRRARHVVTENARALAGAQGVDAAAFGALMAASQRSLRDDYEVSVPALDELVALLEEDPDVYGAKLTGAGFGGACVALCREGRAADAGHRALARYDRDQRRGRMLVPAP